MPPAVMIAGGLGALSAGSQVVEGIQQQKASNAQAAEFQRHAGLAKEEAGTQIGAIDYEANRLMGIARTSAAASGVVPGSGSPKVINMMNASEAILQETAKRYSGELQSSSDLAQAANARLTGKQQLYGSLIGAGKTALTSALGIAAPRPMGLGWPPSASSGIGKLLGP
jgi:hypothetical protein